jgi:hypothetical protein
MSEGEVFLVYLLQTFGAFAICLFALWKGGLPERFGGGLLICSIVLTRIATTFASDAADPIIRLISDGLTALGLLVVALAYGSLWIGGVMLLQAAQFTLHSYYFVTKHPIDRFHAVVNNVNLIGILLCLVLGALIAWRQRVVAARRAAEAAEPTSIA